MKKNIPNYITLLNLLSGMMAIYFVFKQEWEMAFLFLFIGIFFDFIDGFVARKLNVSSEMGLQLDSLADMVTSGVVPALVLFFMLVNSLGMNWQELDLTNLKHLLPFVAFIIALGSAWRLAVFNTDDRQTVDFIGLPTPANALFIASLPLVLSQTKLQWVKDLLTNPYVLIAISIFSVYLLNMNFKLFSLKFKDFTWKNNQRKYILILASIILLVFLKIQAVPCIIFVYLLLSLFSKKNTAF